ncbi:hypothetical protein Tco_1090982 [Tanacetum coccineum]|uniref:Uncharacterized protein n=1 Tax=Tanacetum coccineum TaxID=301880 RepID=A0ABQ5I6W2_9ASTR
MERNGSREEEGERRKDGGGRGWRRKGGGRGIRRGREERGQRKENWGFGGGRDRRGGKRGEGVGGLLVKRRGGAGKGRGKGVYREGKLGGGGNMGKNTGGVRRRGRKGKERDEGRGRNRMEYGRTGSGRTRLGEDLEWKVRKGGMGNGFRDGGGRREEWNGGNKEGVEEGKEGKGEPNHYKSLCPSDEEWAILFSHFVSNVRAPRIQYVRKKPIMYKEWRILDSEIQF